MLIIKNRISSLIPALFVLALIVYALYAEYFLYLAPCPLCMVQRYIFIVIGFLFFLCFLFNPKKLLKNVFTVLILIFCSLGIGVAGRHVWLQSLPPDQVPDCGPGLDYMLEAFPLGDLFKELFYGAGECAESVWQFLGLSMAGWALICFIALFIYTIFWTTKYQSRTT